MLISDILIIFFKKNLHNKNVEVKLTSITCCHSVWDILKDKLSFVIPALLINISGQPSNSSQTESTNFSIVGFVVNTENDLVPYELEEFPGRTFYQNAGKTLRKGIEIEFIHRLNKNFLASIIYNYTNFKYDEYISGDLNLKENYLPGIPTRFGNF